ncbi:hypothetical protein [Candidatus Enterovibrio escicola]|uniref:Uncharacterized protein n=1 Tax=Candidatus Enterovibrio escicola TaxID=1927127 RepID=A0A2A5SZF5_9GAMM|nr:hypothetical protein [Candidatus Enterovibrio escacola]PCS21297.1 hypothetical protein BTN49_3187 [Candidatus Enterovibrio escacola]
MNKTILLSVIFATSVSTQEHDEVTVFDDRIVIELSNEVRTEFDESPYWVVLNEHGWKAAQSAVSELDVSPNLTKEIKYQKSLSLLTSYVKNGHYIDSNELISQYPEWSNCARIQWVWLDLQNEVSTGYGPLAKEKYQLILNDCIGHELSTTQKLITWSSHRASRDILSLYRGSDGYDPEKGEKMERDIALARLAKYSVSNRELHRIGKSVLKDKDAKSAELIGWKFLNNDDAENAVEWFEHSIDWSGATAKRIEGKLLSLERMEKWEQLDLNLTKWSEKYPSIVSMDFDTGAKDDLSCKKSAAHCLKMLDKHQSFTASDYALKGWKLYELERPMSAVIEFEIAVSLMSPSDPEWDLIQYGYVLSLEKSGFSNKAQVHAMQIDSEKIRGAIGKKIALKHIYNAFEAETFATTVYHIDEYIKKYGKDIKLTEIKAWSLYNSNRKVEAFREYTKLAEAFPYNDEYQRSYMIIKCGLMKQSGECRQYNS